MLFMIRATASDFFHVFRLVDTGKISSLHGSDIHLALFHLDQIIVEKIFRQIFQPVHIRFRFAQKKRIFPEHLQRPVILPPHQCTAVVFKREPGLLGRYLYLAAKKHRRSRVIKFHSKIRTYFFLITFPYSLNPGKAVSHHKEYPVKDAVHFIRKPQHISQNTLFIPDTEIEYHAEDLFFNEH